MSEVTLHGQPVKVGDKVWNWRLCWCDVVEEEPEPEYDYYWYCERMDFMTSKRCTEQFLLATFGNASEFVRIEESKREVKA